MPTAWLDSLIQAAADALEVGGYEVRAVLAILLVCASCGMVGSLVVGNRMAFFSDAMAHTAFAGVALGLLGLLLTADPRAVQADDAVWSWKIPVVMVSFGVVVGLGIAFVRDRTGLASDTVIGVFFALSIGFAAMVIPGIQKTARAVDPESFLFGSPLFVRDEELVLLLGLVVVTAGFVGWKFNDLVLGSFNPSLARSRGVSVRLNQYLFVVLLALVVNLSIRAVGVLLVNALLVVPAAAAANVSRNVRQLFWLSLAGCTVVGLIGYLVSRNLALRLAPSLTIELRPGGTIVVLAVGWFFLSMLLARLRGRRGRGAGH